MRTTSEMAPPPTAAQAAGGAAAAGGGEAKTELLDLSGIDDLGAEEAAVLQAMREYIRAASGAKMAKIRMWETDNSALLQSMAAEGGGGGGEMAAYRNLSQHVRVHTLAPTPDGGPATGGGGLKRRNRYSWCGVATHWFKQDRTGFHIDLTHLLGHDEAVVFIADQQRLPERFNPV